MRGVKLHRLDPCAGGWGGAFRGLFSEDPGDPWAAGDYGGTDLGRAAYLTDMSDIPDVSMGLLQGLDVLILDSLRREPHPSHSHLAKSIAFVEKLKPKRAFFTHIGHDLDHEGTEAELPPHIRLCVRWIEDRIRDWRMKIYRGIEELRIDGPVVATIGNFDGVHRGHQWVMDEVIGRARELGAGSLAVTFDPHPARMLRPEKWFPMIYATRAESSS